MMSLPLAHSSRPLGSEVDTGDTGTGRAFTHHTRVTIRRTASVRSAGAISWPPLREDRSPEEEAGPHTEHRRPWLL